MEDLSKVDLLEIIKGDGYLNHKMVIDANASQMPVKNEYKLKKRFQISSTQVSRTSKFLGGGHYGGVVAGVYNDRQVAIKTQDRSLVFHNEIVKHQRLRHKYIAEFIGASTDPTDEFMVTELIDGVTLNKYLSSPYSDLKEKSLLKISIQIAEALEYCHQEGVYHCDVTGKNIMIDSFGNVKLIDFGISKDNGFDHIGEGGDYLYIDPHVIKFGRAAYCASSDIYSFALILYQIMTLKNPIPDGYEGTVQQWAEDVAFNGSRLSLDGIREDISNIIQRCWDRDHNSSLRFTQIKEELQSIYTSSSSNH